MGLEKSVLLFILIAIVSFTASADAHTPYGRRPVAYKVINGYAPSTPECKANTVTKIIEKPKLAYVTKLVDNTVYVTKHHTATKVLEQYVSAQPQYLTKYTTQTLYQTQYLTVTKFQPTYKTNYQTVFKTSYDTVYSTKYDTEYKTQTLTKYSCAQTTDRYKYVTQTVTVYNGVNPSIPINRPTQTGYPSGGIGPLIDVRSQKNEPQEDQEWEWSA